MKKIILESPYKGEIELNLVYARACMRNSISNGESPIASHLIYTQEGILDDNIPEERELGIRLFHIWLKNADYVVVYNDLGVSDGMLQGIRVARENKIKVFYRGLKGKDLDDVFRRLHNSDRPRKTNRIRNL